MYVYIYIYIHILDISVLGNPGRAVASRLSGACVVDRMIIAIAIAGRFLSFSFSLFVVCCLCVCFFVVGCPGKSVSSGGHFLVLSYMS